MLPKNVGDRLVDPDAMIGDAQIDAALQKLHAEDAAWCIYFRSILRDKTWAGGGR